MEWGAEGQTNGSLEKRQFANTFNNTKVYNKPSITSLDSPKQVILAKGMCNYSKSLPK